MVHRVVSVIVPAYNAAGTLGDCLEALRCQELPPGVRLEIIVADDRSGDNTLEIARRAGAFCVQTDTPASGAGAARNRAVEASTGDPLLFTDADCTPSSRWASTLLRALEDPEVVGAKGTYATSQRELIARFVQLEYEDKYRRMEGLETIDFIDTYSAAYRRRPFIENGGFDAGVRSVEDQELSFRLARKGYRLVFAPQAVVRHLHVKTAATYFRRKFLIGYWKAVLLRWHPERTFTDSHTHPAQRWQIALLGLSVLAGLLTPLATHSAWIALAGLGTFELTTIPFLVRILRRDSPVVFVAPFALILRAAALGTGLMAGFLRPPKRRSMPRSAYRPLTRWIKRLVDIAGGLVGSVLSFPVLLVAAVAIRLDCPGPVFFVQDRVGEHGRPFRLFKLRTMRDDGDRGDAPATRERFLSGGSKQPDDPRVTRVGRFLRRWSLDELPQFWNVLRGEMSLVGPRPEEMGVVALYTDEQRRRLAVKPGLTGPMQIAGRGDLDMETRLRLELDYIENYSLWRDLHILFLSFGAVVSGRGAY